MSEVRTWLETIGLTQYADAFEANEIDMDLLGQVDDQILKDIGVSAAGHRLRIRKAVAEMRLVVPPDAKATAAVDAPEIPRASAERRQRTVMFCDLAGSTELSSRLDPEDLRGIIGACHRCCTDLIERHGGFVAKYMGDGVLAYFGYPQAHEHDAESAVRAGLDLVEAVPKLETAAGSDLPVRVGIARHPVSSYPSDSASGRTPSFLVQQLTMVRVSTAHTGSDSRMPGRRSATALVSPPGHFSDHPPKLDVRENGKITFAPLKSDYDVECDVCAAAPIFPRACRGAVGAASSLGPVDIDDRLRRLERTGVPGRPHRCASNFLSGPTLIAEGKTMLDQRVCPLSDLASLEKFRDLAVIHVFAYSRVN